MSSIRECPDHLRRHFDDFRNREYHALEDLDPFLRGIEEQTHLMHVRLMNGLEEIGVRAPDFDFPFDVPVDVRFH